ncbi:MAG: sporulation protein YqfD [Oscillospiraceae bacterium]|nr:sporulation protein YqfD [Oscillospiraceae bacterium]
MAYRNYVEFTAFGSYSSQFIDYLINSGYAVWDINSSNEIYTVRTSPRSYLAVARKAREFRTKTKVVKRGGVYFTFRRYRKRIGLPIGVLAFLAVIVLMSNFIWSIRIIGNEELSRYRILEQLELHGVKAGIPISGFDAEKVELALTLAFDELAWVNIERVGSRINIKVSERDGTDNSDTIPVSTPCNVIAVRSGQIIDTEVYRGRLLYEIGSGVNAGDIVVSGVVSDGAGGLNYVHADAVLIVQCVEAFEFHQPYATLQKSKNGYSDSNISIIFLGLRFGGEINVSKFGDNVKYTEEVYAPRLFGFPLPYRVLKQDYVYYDRVEVIDSPTTALGKLNNDIELFELYYLDGAELILREIEYFPEEDGVSATVTYVYTINVAQKQEMSLNR